MLKVLLSVDGSPSAVRATQRLIESLDWYKEPPSIDVAVVHLPVPRVPNMGAVVSKEMIQAYYDDECKAMLARPPSRVNSARATGRRTMSAVSHDDVAAKRQ